MSNKNIVDNAEETFKLGVNTMNKWYKFLDKNYYYETANAHFVNAKNMFMINKNFKRCADCYDNIIKCLTSMKDIDVNGDLAQTYDEYADFCVSHNINEHKIVDLFENAKSASALAGKIDKYYSISQKIGNYFYECKDIENAIKYFQQYIDQVENIKSKYSAMKTLELIISICISNGKYNVAINAIKNYLQLFGSDTLIQLKFSIKMMEAVCCNLLIHDNDDLPSSMNLVDEFANTYSYFGNSKEYAVIKNIINYLSPFDDQNFTRVLKEYDEVRQLDPTIVNALSKIKEKFSTGFA